MNTTNKTNELSLVSFSQAERLAKAGFDWPVRMYYSYEEDRPENHEENPREGDYCSVNHLNGAYSAPTVALALKWWWDVYGATCNHEARQSALLDEFLKLSEKEQ